MICDLKSQHFSMINMLLIISETREVQWFYQFFLKISCSAVPFHFARAGVLFDSVNFWGHLLCSVEAEKPDGINGVG